MITIHGTGCVLVDNLYANCDFSAPAFTQALSHYEGDGGLSPGRLVFAEDFQRFIGMPYELALSQISCSPPNSRNLGGPSVVPLAHAAQILGDSADVCFYGVKGNDESADFIENAIKKIPFRDFHLIGREFPSPRTDVISDPNYDNGHGERTFINLLGAANHLYPQDLGADFFNADIIVFGGTAIVPYIHASLTELLQQAKKAGAVTVVNLVYDFLGDLKAPGCKWKLGSNDDAYPHIDVLIADKDEALKTSDTASVNDAIQWFISRGTGSVIITDGSRSVTLAAAAGVFKPIEISSMPVCDEIDRELAAFPDRRGDTTGCGDNFTGGVIASIGEQLGAISAGAAARCILDLRECVIHGIPAGGFACFTFGGAFYESFPGEKRSRLRHYIDSYRRQLAASV